MQKVTDRELLKRVNQKLGRAGSGSGRSKVVAGVRQGDVTLSGVLQYEIHRRSFVKAASGVPGVRRVIDQMTVSPPKDR